MDNTVYNVLETIRGEYYTADENFVEHVKVTERTMTKTELLNELHALVMSSNFLDVVTEGCAITVELFDGHGDYEDITYLIMA